MQGRPRDDDIGSELNAQSGRALDNAYYAPIFAGRSFNGLSEP
jgi:hypothetical protein